MTTPDMTSILEDLAAGRIDAAEAARRIDALKASQPTEETTPSEPTNEQLAGGTADSDPWAAVTDQPDGSYRSDAPKEEAVDEEQARVKPMNTGGVERISVRAIGRRVRIIGETSVATLSADGPHVLRRNGSVLEVSSDGELGASLDGFSILRGAAQPGRLPRTGSRQGAVPPGQSEHHGRRRGNRRQPEYRAGAASRQGPSDRRRRPSCSTSPRSTMRLIQAGQATIKGAITTGRNRIRAESGSLSITLTDDSNVTVTGEAQLGKVSWSGGHNGAGDEVVMGNGSAKLDIEVVMGHAQVRVGSDVASEAGV